MSLKLTADTFVQGIASQLTQSFPTIPAEQELRVVLIDLFDALPHAQLKTHLLENIQTYCNVVYQHLQQAVTPTTAYQRITDVNDVETLHAIAYSPSSDATVYQLYLHCILHSAAETSKDLDRMMARIFNPHPVTFSSASTLDYMSCQLHAIYTLSYMHYSPRLARYVECTMALIRKYCALVTEPTHSTFATIAEALVSIMIALPLPKTGNNSSTEQSLSWFVYFLQQLPLAIDQHSLQLHICQTIAAFFHLDDTIRYNFNPSLAEHARKTPIFILKTARFFTSMIASISPITHPSVFSQPASIVKLLDLLRSFNVLSSLARIYAPATAGDASSNRKMFTLLKQALVSIGKALQHLSQSVADLPLPIEVVLSSHSHMETYGVAKQKKQEDQDKKKSAQTDDDKIVKLPFTLQPIQTIQHYLTSSQIADPVHSVIMEEWGGKTWLGGKQILTVAQRQDLEQGNKRLDVFSKYNIQTLDEDGQFAQHLSLESRAHQRDGDDPSSSDTEDSDEGLDAYVFNSIVKDHDGQFTTPDDDEVNGDDSDDDMSGDNDDDDEDDDSSDGLNDYVFNNLDEDGDLAQYLNLESHSKHETDEDDDEDDEMQFYKNDSSLTPTPTGVALVEEFDDLIIDDRLGNREYGGSDESSDADSDQMEDDNSSN